MAERSEKELLKKKAKALWSDKRTYANRLVLSGAAMFAACFTFIFFGPFEMVAFGKDSFDFTYLDVIWLLLGAMMVTAVVGTLAISLLRGKIYNYVIATLFSVTVAGYLQAALFNNSVGALTGSAIVWSKMKPEMAVSLAAWIVVFIVVITVLYFHRKFWRNMVIGASVLLVVMQLAPVVSILLGVYEETRISDNSNYYFSNDGIQDFSSEENVLVFILDYMDFDYVEFIRMTDPEFFDDFRGFTGYSNAISTYGRTRPSVCNVLTGYNKDAYMVTNKAFFENAWNYQTNNIMDVLQEKGYSIDMYARIHETFGSAEIAQNYVSNLVQQENSISGIVPGTMLKKLMYLSVYRYAPTALKPFFWEYTEFYNDGVIVSNMYDSSNSKVFGLLSEANADRSGKSFKFYHVEGSHPPCYLDSMGEISPTMTNVYEQTTGCLHLMKSVFEQMKALGIYEDATIIITADHGDADKMWDDGFSGMQTALFYKPSESEDTPLVWSDAQVGTDNISATIAKAVGADTTEFGVALDDVGEEDHERRFFRVYDTEEGSGAERIMETYKIVGDAGDFSNWMLEETTETLYPFY